MPRPYHPDRDLEAQKDFKKGALRGKRLQTSGV
jgi:hypothetical protein